MKTEYNLFEQILVKTSKEYGYYNLLKKYYSRERIISNAKNFDGGRSLLNFQQLFGISSPFSSLSSLWIQVNIIVFELLRKHLIDFLKEHDALESFTVNLIRYQQQKPFKTKTVESIDDFINNCIYYNESPLNIFCLAFSWSNTNETYSFWYRLNILYRDYIYRLLFGESYG